MTEIDWRRVAELFADALERPAHARADFIASRCAGQADLRAAVERMLEADADADPEFMQGLDAVSVDEMIRAASEAPRSAGAYHLIREIGRGGTGQVFLAERADGQFQQYGAVKLLKRGMDTDAILARFFRERQIMAGLNHPSIARLLDGGMTDDGRPYFVMEYVAGLPITQYCDERRLSIDERLQLFCEVCLAVEYAHRSLVVHRDLKPSNILITADGQPKLLDFGIAKILSAKRGEDTSTLTNAGVRMLTPEYAAPEQFHGGAITTSTDVYGLGVVLYELLAGCRPFAARRDQLPSRETLEREAPLLTRAAEVAGDSRSVGGDAATDTVIAAARSSEPSRLRRQLAGDLETIVATALRASPERRYASVEAFRDDIRRHQQRLPVKARPATMVYRVSRFVRRNRVATLSATAIAAVVLTFGGMAMLQAQRISKQAIELEIERDRAQDETATAQQVSDFLVSVFQVSDPMAEGSGDSIRARELLDRGAARIERDLAGQPELQARMLAVMGRAYDNLSHSDRAEPLLRRAVDLHRVAAGDTSAAVVSAMQQLATVQQRRDRAGAIATLQAAIARQEQIDVNSDVMWSLLVDLALAFHERGDEAIAASTVAAALERLGDISIDRLAASHETLRRFIVLSQYTRDWDKLDIAHRRMVEVEAIREGPRSAAVAVAYADWARARQQAGLGVAGDRSHAFPRNGADTLLSIAAAMVRDLDTTSLETAEAMSDLAAVARIMGSLDQSDSLYRAALEVSRAVLGDDHREVALMRMNFAATLQRRGMHAEAVPLLEKAITALRRDAELIHVVLVTEFRLAVATRDAGRVAASIPIFQKTLAAFEATFPPDYIITANVRHDFAKALVGLDRAAEAEPVLNKAIPVLARRWGENDGRVDDARITLANALTSRGRYGEAAELIARVLDRLEPDRTGSEPLAQRARDAHRALEEARSRNPR